MSKSQEAIDTINKQNELIQAQYYELKKVRNLLARLTRDGNKGVVFDVYEPKESMQFTWESVNDDGEIIIKMIDFESIGMVSDFQRILALRKDLGL